MSESDSTKLCRECDRVLPLREFYRNRVKPSGLGDWCKDCAKAYYAKWYAANRERERAKQAQYRQENLEKIAATAVEYRRNNADKIAARRQDPEVKQRMATLHKEWVQRNRHKMVEYENRRNARKKGAIGQEWYTRQEIFERDRWICQLCGDSVEENPTIDHIIPLSKGGPDTPANVQLAHLTCNLRKGTKLL